MLPFCFTILENGRLPIHPSPVHVINCAQYDYIIIAWILHLRDEANLPKDKKPGTHVITFFIFLFSLKIFLFCLWKGHTDTSWEYHENVPKQFPSVLVFIISKISVGTDFSQTCISRQHNSIWLDVRTVYNSRIVSFALHAYRS